MLKWANRNQRSDLLDFSMRTLPTHVIVDSGDSSTSIDSERDSTKNWKGNIATALSESLGEFKNVMAVKDKVQDEANGRTNRAKLLKQLNMLLQMRR